MLSFPSSSRHLPKGSGVIPVQGFRREITAWRALVWAFADEIVLASSSIGAAAYANTGYAMSGLGRERIGGGCINGFYEPHADARLIHDKLREWFDGDRQGANRVMWHAERRKAIAPTIEVQRVRLVRQYEPDGSPRMRRERRNNRTTEVYCFVDFEGDLEEVASQREAAYREFYAMFLAFLDVMPGFELSKWIIAGRGVA